MGFYFILFHRLFNVLNLIDDFVIKMTNNRKFCFQTIFHSLKSRPKCEYICVYLNDEG